jgi:hydroxyacylglutathione hydrolase
MFEKNNIMKITAQIHLVKHTFFIPVTPGKGFERFVYSLILFGKKITLIDSGVRGSNEKIFRYIRENGRKENEISTLILTHSHPDHIGSAAVIRERTGCRILAHPGEKEWMEDINLQNQQRPVPGFFSLADRSVIIDEFVSDGDIFLKDTDTEFRFIHTPGHSKGLLSIFFPAQKILFTADAVPLKDDIPNYDDYTELVASMLKIKQNRQAECLLSSWAEPACGKKRMRELINSGEAYIKKLHEAVLDYYSGSDKNNFDNCRNLISGLGLPPVYANLLAHRAFLSHFRD